MSGILRQSATIFALGWLVAPASFITSVIVAREVGPDGKGVLFLLGGLSAVMTGLVGFGIGAGAAVLYRQKRLTAAEILGSAFVLTGLALALGIAAYSAFADGFLRLFLGASQGSPMSSVWIALALAPVFPTALLAVTDVLLIADDAMRIYALRSVGSAIVGLSLTWLLTVKMGFGVAGVLWSQFAASLFGIPVVVALWLMPKGILGDIRFSMSASRELLRIGLQQYLTALLSLATRRFDAFFIARMLSIKETGYYATANSFHNVLLTVPRATVWPLVSRFSSESNTDILVRVCRLQFVLMLAFTGLLIAIARPMIDVVFGVAFEPAVAPLRWALAGVPFAPVALAVSAYLTAHAKLGRSAIPMAVAGLLQVMLNVLLVPTYGAIGSAVALSAQLVCFAVLQLLAVPELRERRVREFFVPARGDLRVIVLAVRALRKKGPPPA